MNLTLDMFENAVKLSQENRNPSHFVMSRSNYEAGIEIWGKKAMEDALTRNNAKVIDKLTS